MLPPPLCAYACSTFCANGHDVFAPTDRSPPHEVVPPGSTPPDAAAEDDDDDGLEFVAFVAETAGFGGIGRAVAAEVTVGVAVLWEKTPATASAPTVIAANATTPSRISARGFPERFGGGFAGGGIA